MCMGMGLKITNATAEVPFPPTDSNRRGLRALRKMRGRSLLASIMLATRLHTGAGRRSQSQTALQGPTRVNKAQEHSRSTIAIRGVSGRSINAGQQRSGQGETVYEKLVDCFAANMRVQRSKAHLAGITRSWPE